MPTPQQIEAAADELGKVAFLPKPLLRVAARKALEAAEAVPSAPLEPAPIAMLAAPLHLHSASLRKRLAREFGRVVFCDQSWAERAPGARWLASSPFPDLGEAGLFVAEAAELEEVR